MASPTGLALAAGGIAIANEAVFAPLAGQGTPWQDLNWRLIPATALLAVMLTGISKLAPDFANVIGFMAIGAVLITPIGKAPTPLENVVKVLGVS